MRFTGAIACLIVALDCVGYADGSHPQHLFGPDMAWLWWPAAVGWIVSSLALVVRPRVRAQ